MASTHLHDRAFQHFLHGVHHAYLLHRAMSQLPPTMIPDLEPMPLPSLDDLNQPEGFQPITLPPQRRADSNLPNDDDDDGDDDGDGDGDDDDDDGDGDGDGDDDGDGDGDDDDDEEEDDDDDEEEEGEGEGEGDDDDEDDDDDDMLQNVRDEDRLPSEDNGLFDVTSNSAHLPAPLHHVDPPPPDTVPVPSACPPRTRRTKRSSPATPKLCARRRPCRSCSPAPTPRPWRRTCRSYVLFRQIRKPNTPGKSLRRSWPAQNRMSKLSGTRSRTRLECLARRSLPTHHASRPEKNPLLLPPVCSLSMSFLISRHN